MIRPGIPQDLSIICTIINDGAQAYRGIIPADRWQEPYMPLDKLEHEIELGVVFSVYEENGEVSGVMGLQHVQDVTLIRHAYVGTTHQQKGIGAKLLAHLRNLTSAPVLIGTWADAAWAIRFYERYGFEKVSPEDKQQLLRRYWTVPDRQIETSVVLADAAWRARQAQQQSVVSE